MSGFDLKVERMRRRLTQWELAKLTDIAPYIISRIEQGRAEPTEEEIARLREALEQTAGEPA